LRSDILTAGGLLFFVGFIWIVFIWGGTIVGEEMAAADLYWPSLCIACSIAVVSIGLASPKKPPLLETIFVPVNQSQSNTQEPTQQQVPVQNITYNTITNIHDSSVVSDAIVNVEKED
jgi:hypothetical protein